MRTPVFNSYAGFQRVPLRGPLGQPSTLLDAEESANAERLLDEPSPLKQFFSLRFYQHLVVESFAAIISAVAVYYAMRYIERRSQRKNGKRRRNGRKKGHYRRKRYARRRR